MDFFNAAELYGEAILHESSFFYEFDVTDGFIRNNLHTKGGYDPFFGLKLCLPIGYDELNTIRRQKLNIIAETEKEAEYWTCEGLKKAYEEGMRSVGIHYHSELLLLSWTATVVLAENPENGHLCALYMCRDITEIKNNDRIKREELVDTLEDARTARQTSVKLLYNMSHDIRDSLISIAGYADLAERHLDNPDKICEYIGKIRSAGSYINEVIDNAMDMARLENSEDTLNERPWNIHEFNDMIFLIFYDRIQEKNIDFKRTFRVNHENVLCDTKKLREVFCSILVDVLDKTPKGGKVTMSLVEIPTDRPGYVILKTVISDTSVDTTQKETELMLQGEGGRSNIAALVDILEGSFSVNCTEGYGRTFTIILPHRLAVAQEVVEPNSRSEDFNSEEFVDKRILLVEDNALNSEIAGATLEDIGFEVEFAEDGEACIEMLESMDAGYYDLVMMDLQLPNISGFEACRQIRAMDDPVKSTIPVVAVTIHTHDEAKAAAFESGMNGFLSKPVRVDKLIEIIRNIFN